MTEKYNLSWSNFQNHTSSAFQDLLEQTDFVDVTLACEEDKHVTAHKIILSAWILKKCSNTNALFMFISWLMHLVSLKMYLRISKLACI